MMKQMKQQRSLLVSLLSWAATHTHTHTEPCQNVEQLQIEDMRLVWGLAGFDRKHPTDEIIGRKIAASASISVL